MTQDENEWDDARPIRKGQAWVQRDGDQTAVFNPETGFLHMLNPSALAIWELCDGETTAAEMAAAIDEVTGLGTEASLTDVRSGLTSLRDADLVEG